MDAAQALADLTEISSQIESAVIATRKGAVLASTFGDDGKGKDVAGLALELMAGAEEARGEGEPIVQLEAATRQGSVFVVRDDRNIAAAVTTPKPTVGLVFYDLKTCLRLLEQEQEAAKPARRPRKKKEEKPVKDEEESGS
jgi:predicted regulator of Ras-like GTPase activity (Roadblock/LC7/MglB family)